MKQKRIRPELGPVCMYSLWSPNRKKIRPEMTFDLRTLENRTRIGPKAIAFSVQIEEKVGHKRP